MRNVPLNWQISIYGFFLICLVGGGGLSVLMHLNRKPGTPFFTNLVSNPQHLNERGLRARKWVFVFWIVAAIWVIGSIIVDVLR
jgi:hypothetical protein